MNVDLDKARRFALVVGLLLITYATAIEFDASRTINPLGLPFKVVKPELLPIGLVLASVFSALRFAYYGYLATPNPAPSSRRKWLQDYLDKGRDIDEALKYEVSFLSIDEYRNVRDDLYRLFPAAKLVSSRDEIPNLRVTLSRWTRPLQFIADLDFTAPIWVNAAALLIFGARVASTSWS